jgi:4-hydroxy-tetrahydrodipicolinate synthase
VRPQVIAAVPTPFTESGELDLPAARALYAHLLEPDTGHPLDGLLIAGTTGEFPALDDDERLALVSVALAVGGPSRVIAHVGSASARQAVRLASAAVAAGAQRVAAITPYYLEADDREVLDYYRQVAAAAVAAGVREVYAYLFTERTGFQMSPALLGEVLALPGMVGAKISGAAVSRVGEFAAVSPAGQLFCGTDAGLVAAVARGAAGVISGLAAAFPQTTMAVAEQVAAGTGADSGAGRAVQRDLDRATLASDVGGNKAALAARGLSSPHVRMPVAVPDAATTAKIAELVAELD